MSMLDKVVFALLVVGIGAGVMFLLPAEDPSGGALLCSALLFGIGLIGVILRRNVLIVLMSIELMLNASNLTLLAFARVRADMTGHGLAFMIIALAAAEAAVGLAIVVSIFRTRRTVNVDQVNLMKN
jgi:NADH-quinone oxidoreductase subunit K